MTASSPPPSADGRQATTRDWIALGVISLASIVISVDQTALNVALPTLVRQLHPTRSGLQWIADGYTLTNAVLLLLGGALGDRFGRRRVFLVGLSIFGLGSLTAALVHSTGPLIGTRVAMGLGAAWMMPGTLSIIATTFTGRQRANAIGIWAGVNGIGTAAGPVVGGTLLQHFWWGSIFLINVPLVAVALLVGSRVLHESRADVKPRLDPVAVLLSAGGMAVLTYAAIQAPGRGWSSVTVLGGVGVGAALLLAFRWWDRRSHLPFLDLTLFRSHTFTGALAAVSAMFFALFGVQFLVSQYLQFVQGDDALGVGVRFLPLALVSIVASILAARLTARFGLWPLLLAGMTTLMIGLVVDATFVTATSGYLPLGTALALIGLGLGLAVAPASAAVVNSVPIEKVGAAAGVRSTVQLLGGSFGVAVIGSIAATRYHQQVDTAFRGSLAALPPAARPAVRDQIGAAHEVAQSLPSGLAQATDAVANAAYVSGFRLAATTGAAVLAVATIVAARYAPRRSTT